MKNSKRVFRSLVTYREHLRDELEQMKYGQVSHITTNDTLEAPDHVTNVIAIVAMMLIFASIFLVQ